MIFPTRHVRHVIVLFPFGYSTNPTKDESVFSSPPKKKHEKPLDKVNELEEKRNRKHRHEHSLQMFNLKHASSLPNKSSWWFQIFFSHPYLQKWSNLTHIFQMGWLYQPEIMAALQLDAFHLEQGLARVELRFQISATSEGSGSDPNTEAKLGYLGGGVPWDWICEQGWIL